MRAQRDNNTFVFRDRSADAVGTISVEKRSFLHHRSTSRTRLLFTPPSPARNEKRDTRREKKRLAHLKTPRPFKDVTARRNQKGGKTFLLLPLFTQKPETGVSRTSLFAVLPLAPKRLTLCLRWSLCPREKRHAELFLNEAFFLPFWFRVLDLQKK